MPVEITIPGSKSLTNRALILAALSSEKTEISNIAICDDTKSMIDGLRALGISITQYDTKLTIKGNTFKKGGNIEIYTGNAGTTTRFLTALCTLTENNITISGNERMHERPIQPLVDALNKLGAKIESTNGCPPLKIYPQKLTGGEITLPGDISSQYLSALLMTTPFALKPSTINIGQNLCSKPYIKMTLETMKQFNLAIKNNNFEQFQIPSGQKSKTESFTVESDASSASYIGAYAALNHGKIVELNNIYKNSLQGDIKFLSLLEQMGCTITEKQKGSTIEGPQKLSPLGTIDMNECPDLVMTFAILSIFTPGRTKITNIPNLRIKETDRLAALEAELKKLKINVSTGNDYIEIEGNPNFTAPQSEIKIETYDDHRIAMSFGLLAKKFPQIKILNPECVSKSYPSFWEDLNKLP